MHRLEACGIKELARGTPAAAVARRLMQPRELLREETI
jgi:hypothetical protein